VREILSSGMAHPEGESHELVVGTGESSAVDTFGGKIFVRWDPEAAVTAFGPVSYFIDFSRRMGYGSSG
jgi:hypothetical protein